MSVNDLLMKNIMKEKKKIFPSYSIVYSKQTHIQPTLKEPFVY